MERKTAASSEIGTALRVGGTFGLSLLALAAASDCNPGSPVETSSPGHSQELTPDQEEALMGEARELMEAASKVVGMKFALPERAVTACVAGRESVEQLRLNALHKAMQALLDERRTGGGVNCEKVDRSEPLLSVTPRDEETGGQGVCMKVDPAFLCPPHE